MPSFTTKQAKTPEEIQQCRDIRFAVFIDEQVSGFTERRTVGRKSHAPKRTSVSGREATLGSLV